jgi:hypothetical protein
MESLKQREQKKLYRLDTVGIPEPLKPGIDYIDIAGNNVTEYMRQEQLKHVATIKDKIEFKPMEFEGLISHLGIIKK